MTVSGLHLSYYDISAAVGHALGYGRTSTGWSDAQLNDIHAAMDDGCRLFYGSYEWSFLVPQATITTESGTSTYDLPDDFASPRGSFIPPAQSGRRPLIRVGEAKLRDLQTSGLQGGYPSFCVIRPKDNDGESAQTYEVEFYPTPSAEEALSYSYNRLVPYQLRSTYLYHLGGAAYSAAVQAACVAKAMEMQEGTPAEENSAWKRALADAIANDKRLAPDIVGHISGREVMRYEDSSVTLTVDGVEI